MAFVLLIRATLSVGFFPFPFLPSSLDVILFLLRWPFHDVDYDCDDKREQTQMACTSVCLLSATAATVCALFCLCAFLWFLRETISNQSCLTFLLYLQLVSSSSSISCCFVLFTSGRWMVRLKKKKKKDWRSVTRDFKIKTRTNSHCKYTTRPRARRWRMKRE